MENPALECQTDPSAPPLTPKCVRACILHSFKICFEIWKTCPTSHVYILYEPAEQISGTALGMMLHLRKRNEILKEK